MSTNIYILRLENDKWYVGKSIEPEKSYQHHIQGCSKWTLIHKPLELYKIIPTSNTFDEDRYVKELMLEYGIDNVRGGSYNRIELSDYQYRLIQRELFTASDGSYQGLKKIRCNVRNTIGVILCFTNILFIMTTIIAGSRCWN